jgi:hypothetical protein
MKVKSANIVKTKLPSKSAFQIETEPDFIKLHTLMVINGKRGGGKTVALCNFLRECKSKHYYDRIFVITPTYNSNKTIWDIADIPEEDAYEPELNVIHDIVKLCEAEKAEWDNFLQQKELYKQFRKDANKPVQRIDEENLIHYYNFGFYDAPPKWKYPVEQPPRLGIVLDDCLNSEVMTRRTAGLTNLAIRHRHICDGLGVSLFMLVQSYACQGGVPRVIRENCTHLLLFKINQEQQIKKIIEESDLEVSNEEFMQMLDTAHAEDYQFLMIDFANKCMTKKYRIGFNQYIVPSCNEGKCKCSK